MNLLRNATPNERLFTLRHHILLRHGRRRCNRTMLVRKLACVARPCVDPVRRRVRSQALPLSDLPPIGN